MQSVTTTKPRTNTITARRDCFINIRSTLEEKTNIYKDIDIYLERTGSSEHTKSFLLMKAMEIGMQTLLGETEKKQQNPNLIKTTIGRRREFVQGVENKIGETPLLVDDVLKGFFNKNGQIKGDLRTKQKWFERFIDNPDIRIMYLGEHFKDRFLFVSSNTSWWKQLRRYSCSIDVSSFKQLTKTTSVERQICRFMHENWRKNTKSYFVNSDAAEEQIIEELKYAMGLGKHPAETPPLVVKEAIALRNEGPEGFNEATKLLCENKTLKTIDRSNVVDMIIGDVRES